MMLAKIRLETGVTAMEQSSRSKAKLSRRSFLQKTTAAGIGIGLIGPRLINRAEAQQTTVTFSGWAFEPQVVEANVKRFMEQNKDIIVKYTPLDLQLYNEKMVAL